MPAAVPFGALGGDSLLAAGVTARMRRRWGDTAVTLRQFHADPTIAGLARLLPPDAQLPAEAGRLRTGAILPRNGLGLRSDRRPVQCQEGSITLQ